MLELHGISRSFGDRLVLDDVSFTVGRGRLTGFVGGNGAGKTTAMRIILGVLAAHAGTVTVDGTPVAGVQRARFGYMPEERGLYPKMQLVEHLTYLARLHGFDKQGATQRAEALVERLGLASRAKDPVENLSLGNQQRAQVAAALVHDPEILILDEPFSGLDPMAVEVVQGVLAERAEQGAPVLFSSHQLDVVERLCDDLVIIAGGKVRAAGTREDLRQRFGQARHEIVAPGDMGWLRDVPGVRVDELAGGSAVFEAADDVAQQVLTSALARGPVLAFTPLRPTLAEIFRDVVADEPEMEEVAR
ncbi:ABC transporter ATP-binding protein [Cellulomonas xiejunii]|uniref:ATP-binding cassette domain-containing protein n=1 Tax=Cellulomonas xiejunii TaxID=2968083 RepID=A0ABY5KSJ5_9CELL|nr:ATP-binding cassette domain-containing protein [Cellulomonas xiejunii]MCC2314603.1 ATP-binding cassette domain-containing protein [Cellulomonas xiejunii]MCC2322677.1 ATP-binding cassette domain-containing protein [Cellulomonas xiejunii]UUI72714.1 ATP-binding cassette domain-containing protein [Cellulomonas xiejunii]